MIALTASPLVIFDEAELLRPVADSHGTGHLECPTVFPQTAGRGPLLGFCTIWDNQAWTLSLDGWRPGDTLPFSKLRRFELPGFTGGMARCCLNGKHGAVVGNGRKLAFLDLDSGKHADLFGGHEFGGPDIRLNELYVSNAGNLLAGTMHIPCSEAVAGVHRITPQGGITEVIRGCTVANGMWEWPLGFGQIDSPTQMGRRYINASQDSIGAISDALFDLGDPSAPAAVFPFNKNTDVPWRGPDGAARTESWLLVAIFNAGVVAIFDIHGGNVLGAIRVPAPCPTSVCVADIEVDGKRQPVAFITASAETISPASRVRAATADPSDPWAQNLRATGVYCCLLPDRTKVVGQNEFVLDS